jgi:hypothetical protein
MTGGLDPVTFQTMHGESFHAVYGSKALASIEAGLACYTGNGHFALTRQGMDVMNTVLLDFM